MDSHEAEVRQLEKTRSVQQLPADPVVFYGSSSLRLWDTLATDLGNPRAVNQAFGGSTLEACVHYFERLVLPLRPRSLVLYAGDNDLGDGHTPRHVLASFRALKTKLKKFLPETKLTFLSIKPSPARTDILPRIREANTLVRRELESSPGCPLYIDLFEAMLDAHCHPRPELFTDDGLHMNVNGYRLWTDLISPYRHRIFAKASLPVQSQPLS